MNNRDKAIKANELVEEIDELKKSKKIMESSKQRNFHFEFRPHYGKCLDSEMLMIEEKHNHRFINIINEIINELEQELGYTLKLQALVYRPVIRSDMPEAFLNRMTNEELLVWYEELRQEFLKQGIDESMLRWKLMFDEKVVQRSDVFEILMDNYKGK